MKKTTYLLPKKSFLKLILLFSLTFYSNFCYSQFDLRNCGYNCTSNNYTLNDVFLSLTDVYGVPISNSTCNIGDPPISVYVLLNYTSNANSSVYFARFIADLSINGNVQVLNNYVGTVNPGAGQRKLYGPFNWSCGDELILSRIFVTWRTSSNQDPGPNYNCSNYGSAQCDLDRKSVV